MDLILAALIVGVLIYGGAAVLDYLKYAAQILQCISRLEEEALRLGAAADAEDARRVQAKDRIGHLNSGMGALQQEIVALQGLIQTERERRQRIDMALFKERLKGHRLAMVA